MSDHADGCLPSEDAAAAARFDAGAAPRDTGAVGVGPVFDALAVVVAAIGEVQGLLTARQVPVTDLAGLATGLHAAGNRLTAAHLTAVAQVAAGDALPPGPASVTAWIAGSHRLPARTAGGIKHTAAWLAAHPHVAAALADASITPAHVAVMRAVSSRNNARRAAFTDGQDTLIGLAAAHDPETFAAIMAGWADLIDPDTTDDDADAAHTRRRVYLSPLADGWDLSGWLPDLLGAELAGILNELMEQQRRTTNNGNSGDGDFDGGCEAGEAPDEPASARRADALLDAARTAAAGLTDAARTRAATTVLIPITRLHTCPACTGHHHTPDQPCTGPGSALWTPSAGSAGAADATDADAGADAHGAGGAGAGAGVPDPLAGYPACGCDHCRDTTNNPTTDTDADIPTTTTSAAAGSVVRPEHLAATWAVGNGPGTGVLAGCEAAWATCDGEITRLIHDPDSRPLDIGHTTRVIPAHLRTALAVRDRGCIIPGCDRPPGWCHAHHLHHWADGGSTSLSNLALLCPKHHKELHLGHWHITMVDGRPHATHIPTHQRPQHRRQQQRRQQREHHHRHERQPPAA